MTLTPLNVEISLERARGSWILQELIDRYCPARKTGLVRLNFSVYLLRFSGGSGGMIFC